MNTTTTPKNKLYFHILLSISFAISLVILRMKITQNEGYFFMIWNLFLAAIPYLISQTMKNHIWLQSSKWLCFSSLAIWLLFLPNSPYMITDLIHLQNNNTNLAWYDLFLVFVFAINGLLLGLLSMLDVFGIIAFRYTKKVAFISLIKISVLTGYGIYLGRILRFNSWDILTKPSYLMQQILQSVHDPKAYLMTFAFGGLLCILFSLVHSFTSHQKQSSYLQV